MRSHNCKSEKPAHLHGRLSSAILMGWPLLSSDFLKGVSHNNLQLGKCTRGALSNNRGWKGPYLLFGLLPLYHSLHTYTTNSSHLYSRWHTRSDIFASINLQLGTVKKLYLEPPLGSPHFPSFTQTGVFHSIKILSNLQKGVQSTT